MTYHSIHKYFNNLRDRKINDKAHEEELLQFKDTTYFSPTDIYERYKITTALALWIMSLIVTGLLASVVSIILSIPGGFPSFIARILFDAWMKTGQQYSFATLYGAFGAAIFIITAILLFSMMIMFNHFYTPPEDFTLHDALVEMDERNQNQFAELRNLMDLESKK